MQIHHPKIETLEPTWAPFQGSSIIFEAFGGRGAPSSSQAGTFDDNEISLDSDGAISAATFYRLISQAFEEAGLADVSERTGLCALPAASYHVTIADLIHQGNVRHLRIGADVFEDGFSQIEWRLELASERVDEAMRLSGICTVDVADLRFQIDEVVNWDDRVLVTRLKPHRAPKSLRAYARLERARAVLTQTLAGMGITLNPYRPHVSLGYFADPDFAQETQAAVVRLNQIMSRVLSDRHVSLGRPAQFRFTDMASYSRVES